MSDDEVTPKSGEWWSVTFHGQADQDGDIEIGCRDFFITQELYALAASSERLPDPAPVFHHNDVIRDGDGVVWVVEYMNEGCWRYNRQRGAVRATTANLPRPLTLLVRDGEVVTP